MNENRCKSCGRPINEKVQPTRSQMIEEMREHLVRSLELLRRQRDGVDRRLLDFEGHLRVLDELDQQASGPKP